MISSSVSSGLFACSATSDGPGGLDSSSVCTGSPSSRFDSDCLRGSSSTAIARSSLLFAASIACLCSASSFFCVRAGDALGLVVRSGSSRAGRVGCEDSAVSSPPPAAASVSLPFSLASSSSRDFVPASVSRGAWSASSLGCATGAVGVRTFATPAGCSPAGGAPPATPSSSSSSSSGITVWSASGTLSSLSAKLSAPCSSSPFWSTSCSKPKPSSGRSTSTVSPSSPPSACVRFAAPAAATILSDSGLAPPSASAPAARVLKTWANKAAPPAAHVPVASPSSSSDEVSLDRPTAPTSP
mmetsp:Transcript_11932/g.28905  ORF Transcript_11932/g.28905 Transcript_11932/m.28905 type:complete len:299 (+) Transcript_11932:362-1258(+)